MQNLTKNTKIKEYNNMVEYLVITIIILNRSIQKSVNIYNMRLNAGNNVAIDSERFRLLKKISNWLQGHRTCTNT